MHTGFDDSTPALVGALDEAMEAHLKWNRQILRCALLRTMPHEDVLLDDAHARCAFGRWLVASRDALSALDGNIANHLDRAHRAMHASIRAICQRVAESKEGFEADLDAFEAAEAELLSLLATAKTKALSTAIRLDPLTGLPMRYGMEHEFERIRRDSQRRNECLCAVMIDIDHFKKINDTYGHSVGDVALRQFAKAIKQTTRANESLYRFGGEEFLTLLRCEREDGIRTALDRLLAVIRGIRVVADPARIIGLTATLGAAVVREGDDLATSVKRADAALYQGKRAGRDRYVLVMPNGQQTTTGRMRG